MARKLFGTDGVRGTANVHPMTAQMALAIGAAAGRYFRREHSGVHRVVIGKDTRLSGYMFENALTAGLTSTGMNVLLLGPVPTPAVGLLTPSMRADLGIMISASHNPSPDNGIKFFGPDGFKLSDEAEAEIEALVDEGVAPAVAGNIGRARRIDDGRSRYQERVKSTFPAGMRLDGMKVVIDCANGAAYRAAPEVLWELGADVIPIGVAPDGTNINQDCGSTKPRVAAETVVAHGAHIGICLDGDADRVMIIDETGTVADGDQIMALMAGRWAEEGRLNHGTLVATVMSNLGLERFLYGAGPPAGTHRRGRPLRGRGDAARRLEPRRRTVGPYRDDGLCHDRRRADGGAAIPRGNGAHRQARQRACPQLRSGAATAAQRALHRRTDAARLGGREGRRFPRPNPRLATRGAC